VSYNCALGVPRGIIATSSLGFSQPQIGGTKRFFTKQALRINRGAPDGLSHNFTFRVTNPSSRLHFAVTVQFETDSGAELSIAGVTWQLQAMLRNAQTNRSSPGQLIYGPVPAPDGYEVDSAVQDVRGTVIIPTGATYGLAAGDGGFWVVQATWEPNVEVSPSDFQDLMTACGLTIDGSPAATTYL
jgi:hypothetical protein